MTYCNEVELAWPVVLVDSQENGIRLVLIVIKCAEAIHQENGTPSDVLVRHVGFLVDFQSGSTREMETCLFEVLARRTNIFLPVSPVDVAIANVFQLHFINTCLMYLKLVHFTATQFILVDFLENSLVCVIIFSKEQSVQWPTLLQAFSSRYGIPFSIQSSGIESLYQVNLVHLQELGWEVDKNACAKFVFRDFIVSSLKDRHTFMFYIFKDGVVAVNFKWGFHYLSAWSWVIKNVFSFVEGYKVMMLKVHDIVDEIAGDAMRVLKYFGEYKHGRYSVQSKLGWDQFSEVWLAWYTQIAEYIAWEVKRSAQHYTKVTMDASILLKQLVIREQDKNCVVKLLDHLEHEDILLIFMIDPSKVSRRSSVLMLLVYFVIALTILVLAILKIFVWNPGLVWFSHFTTLRTRRLLRGRICHVPGFKN